MAALRRSRTALDPWLSAALPPKRFGRATALERGGSNPGVKDGAGTASGVKHRTMLADPRRVQLLPVSTLLTLARVPPVVQEQVVQSEGPRVRRSGQAVVQAVPPRGGLGWREGSGSA